MWTLIIYDVSEKLRMQNRELVSHYGMQNFR